MRTAASVVSITGKKEVVRKLTRLISTLSGEGLVGAQNDVMWALGDAGNIVSAAAKQNARAVNAPPEVVDAIFTYRGNPPVKQKKKAPAALVGVDKSDSMRIWTAGRVIASVKSKVAPGGKVAMSLAAMFEFGTTRRPATGFFSRALIQNRAAVRARLAENFAQIIDRAASR